MPIASFRAVGYIRRLGMLLRNLTRALSWVAFAAMLLAVALVPRSARAAILPACENHPVTPMPAEWLAALAQTDAPQQTDACVTADMTRGDDFGDSRVAAMCDDRGASVVAPPRLLPIADARIEAGSSCGADLAAPACSPGHQDMPLGPPAFALAEQGVLGESILVPSAPSELGPAFPMIVDPALRGVARDIEHPPR